MKAHDSRAIAPAFFKLSAHPDVPVLMERFDGEDYRQVRQFRVESPAEIIPRCDTIPHGLYRITTALDHTQGVRPISRPYLLNGRYTILALGEGMVAPIEQSLRAMAREHT